MQNMQYVEYVEYVEYAWYEEYVKYDEYDEYAWYDKYVNMHPPLEYEPPCFNITDITNMQRICKLICRIWTPPIFICKKIQNMKKMQNIHFTHPGIPQR